MLTPTAESYWCGDDSCPRYPEEFWAEGFGLGTDQKLGTVQKSAPMLDTHSKTSHTLKMVGQPPRKNA